MEKVLITGANGYLGACVFEELSTDKTKSVHKLKGRLNIITPHSIDYKVVIHCAGALRHRKGKHFKTNLEGTISLVNGLSESTKLVYISSKSVYGTKLEGYLTEQAIPQPDDEYGISKYKGELKVIESGLPYIIIRASTLYGLGIRNLGMAFPSVAMQQLYQGKDIRLFAPDILHEYLYVKDLATIISKLIAIPNSWNKVYNISGPRKSLFALINAIDYYLKTNTDNTGTVHITAKEQNRNFYLDSSKLKKILGDNIYTPEEIIIKRMSDHIQSEKS